MIKHEHLAPLRREHRKTVKALANLENPFKGEREALTRKIGVPRTLINPRYSPNQAESRP